MTILSIREFADFRALFGFVDIPLKDRTEGIEDIVLGGHKGNFLCVKLGYSVLRVDESGSDDFLTSIWIFKSRLQYSLQ